jgi:predicted nucleotidyltransferase
MDMIKARNLTSHTSNPEVADSVTRDILMRFYPAFAALSEGLRPLTQPGPASWSPVESVAASLGLSATALAQICAALAQLPQVVQGVVYRSRAKGNFKPGSDIDLTLRGEGLTLSLFGDIDPALDDLLLPYEIDLSIYDQLRHAELVAHVDRVGRVVSRKPLGPSDRPTPPMPTPAASPG